MNWSFATMQCFILRHPFLFIEFLFWSQTDSSVGEWKQAWRQMEQGSTLMQLVLRKRPRAALTCRFKKPFFVSICSFCGLYLSLLWFVFVSFVVGICPFSFRYFSLLWPVFVIGLYLYRYLSFFVRNLSFFVVCFCP